MAKILETTLRDGSYSIDFQFTADDTATVAKALEDFGFEFIEIGHGLGLNASNSGKGTASATDEEYVKAVSSLLRKAKWGTFFIPGIGRLDDIDMALSYGMDFIRVGTNITELEQGRESIEHAKRRGLLVSVNLMKSYAVPPRDFALKAKLARDFGADIVCLVDSAGGMLPEDVERYFHETLSVTDVKLGFHGHNNLLLAVANTLKAIDCGAFLVDSSLQGLGRSAGNAPTEVLVAILKRRGLFRDIDVNALMDFSEKAIKPLVHERGIDSLSVTAGYAQFHSSYFSTIFQYADKYRIDPRELIVELCKTDLVKAPEELVDRLAAELSYEIERRPPRQFLSKQLLDLARDKTTVSLREELDMVLKDMKPISRKLGKTSVFNIVTPLLAKDTTTVSRFIQESFSFVMASAEVIGSEDLRTIVDKVNGEVDVILYDVEQKLSQSSEMLDIVNSQTTKSILLLYRDTDVWLKAIENLILELCRKEHRRAVLVGTNKLVPRLAHTLGEDGYEVYVWGQKTPLEGGFWGAPVKAHPSEDMKADVIVGLDPYSYAVDLSFVKLLSDHSLIVDGGIGTISKEMAQYALSRGMRVIRVDMRGALDAETKSKLNTHELVTTILGHTRIADVECVAGGFYGNENAVVLDSITNPKYIVGLADGLGQVKYILGEQQKELTRRVEKAIFLLP